MAELSAADVETYTRGRLTAANPETGRMLRAALSAARREAGWHVSPVLTHTFSMDGPGRRVLWLPTLKVVSITSVTQDDVVLAPTAYKKSVGDGPGLPRRVALRRVGGGRWSAEYDSIDIVMEHGFTEAEAEDWRQGILSLVDQMSLVPVSGGTGGSAFGQKSLRVDDVAVGFDPYATMADEVLFSIANVLDDYRLPALEFF